MIDFFGFTFYFWLIGFLVTWFTLNPLFGRWSFKASVLWFCFWFDVIAELDAPRFWPVTLICTGIFAVFLIACMSWVYIPLTLLF